MEENYQDLRNRQKRIIEALLFATHEPLTIKRIRTILESFQPVSNQEIEKLMEELRSEYSEHGHAFRVEEIAGGYLLRSEEAYRSFIDQLFTGRRGERLSQASTEVLAIIAYKQPITRAQIEKIRGVDCSSIVQSLEEKGLVAAVGKLDAPGRPSLYQVTEEFLLHYGFRDLSELPQLATVREKEG